MTEDRLASTRDALARHDWQAAFDRAAAPGWPPEQEAARADMLAEAAWWLGRLDECITARERAYRLFDEQGDHRRAGECAVWLYEHHLLGAHPAIAGAWLRRARRVLDDDHDCVAYGALLLREAELLNAEGQFRQAVALAVEVAALARRFGSADLEAEALQTKGRLLIDLGDVREGMGHLDEAMLFAVEGRLRPYSTGKVYCSLISACEELGDLDRAAEWTDATLRWAEQHPFAIFPGLCRIHRAVVLKRHGALRDAEREAQRAGKELANTHLPNSAAAWAEVGDIRRRLGELDRAEEAFRQAEGLCGAACGEAALLRLAQGRIDSAMATITRCLSATGSNRLGRARLLPIYVHVAVAAGDLDNAKRAVDELDQIVQVYDAPFHRAMLLSARGRVYLAAGDHELAAVTLEQSCDAWRTLRVPYEVATAETLLGQARRDAGDDDAATECFADAVRLFETIGAVLDARLLAKDAKPPRPAGLTEREIDVLRLVAAGRTNAEIAAALYLSAKTVSRHVSNIFTKLSVNSRAAATAFAFEHHLVDNTR